MKEIKVTDKGATSTHQVISEHHPQMVGSREHGFICSWNIGRDSDLDQIAKSLAMQIISSNVQISLLQEVPAEQHKRLYELVQENLRLSGSETKLMPYSPNRFQKEATQPFGKMILLTSPPFVDAPKTPALSAALDRLNLTLSPKEKSVVQLDYVQTAEGKTILLANIHFDETKEKYDIRQLLDKLADFGNEQNKVEIVACGSFGTQTLIPGIDKKTPNLAPQKLATGFNYYQTEMGSNFSPIIDSVTKAKTDQFAPENNTAFFIRPSVVNTTPSLPPNVENYAEYNNPNYVVKAFDRLKEDAQSSLEAKSSKQANQERKNYLYADNIQKIKTQLSRQGWELGQRDPLTNVIKATNQQQNIYFHPDKITTSAQDVPTFKLMLECYFLVNSASQLKIIAPNEQVKKIWVTACNQCGLTENLDNIISLANDKNKNTPPAPTPPFPMSMR